MTKSRRVRGEQGHGGRTKGVRQAHRYMSQSGARERRSGALYSWDQMEHSGATGTVSPGKMVGLQAITA